MPNTQLGDDLRSARALIEKPEAWTKGELARNASGSPTSSKAPDAVCFCAEGAVRRAVPDNHRFAYACDALVDVTASEADIFIPVSAINDDPNTTHADILALFDRAIAKAGA